MLQIFYYWNVLFRRSWIKRNQSEIMIGLHCILQNECALLCYQRKLTIKSISPLIMEGQLQSPSMEYCYLSLYVLNWRARLLLDIPSIPVLLQFRLPNKLLLLICHLKSVLSDERHCE